jgi:2-amino-4-hydroxy-6-hydroxymethyldihydropteridine diphosphokinase
MVTAMIIVALGSNLDGPWGTPSQTVERAFSRLNQFPLRLVAQSKLIITEPFGRKNQPNFVNAAALIETALSPYALLRKLHMIERAAGRQRRTRWGPRTLDLDLIDYHGLIRSDPAMQLKQLVLPHPGIAMRDFVLQPIAEMAPRWRHPKLHKSAAQLLG